MEKLSKHIPQIVQAIRTYTNRPFIGNVIYHGEIDIVNEDISPFLKNLRAGDVIEILGSVYSDGVYLVKDDKSIYGALRDEKFKGYIVLLALPLNITSLGSLATYSEAIAEKPAIRREGIGDVSFTLHSGSDLIQGYPKTIMSSLSSYRKLPSNYKKEWYYALNSTR